MSQIAIPSPWLGWHVALRLGRVSNLPTVWTNVVAGVVLSGGTMDAFPLVLLIVALSLFYVAGMYLNDAFDRKTDARERPERPIPSGQVRTSTVFAIGFSLLLAGEGVLAIISYGLEGGQGWPPLVAGVALAAAIVYYDMHHKTNPLSPVVMGSCRALVYVTAALAVTSSLSNPVLWGAGLMLAYLIGLTYAAKQENLAKVKNVLALGVPCAPIRICGDFGIGKPDHRPDLHRFPVVGHLRAGSPDVAQPDQLPFGRGQSAGGNLIPRRSPHFRSWGGLDQIGAALHPWHLISRSDDSRPSL